MQVRIKADKVGLDKTCHDILRALLGEVDFYSGTPSNELEQSDLVINLITEVSQRLRCEAFVSYRGTTIQEIAEDTVLVFGEEANQIKRLAKLAVYKAVIKILRLEPLPWGILTGIRPTKIVHRLFDLGWSKETVEEHLITSYGMNASKAAGLVEVAGFNRKFLLGPAEAIETISIYIGIPFCPTRCAYCSFPSYPVAKNKDMVSEFLKALHEEIRAVGSLLRDNGLKVQSLYIGGGTPTTLDAAQLASLFENINQGLISPATKEITLEAGRPDTIDKEKLKVSKAAGVTRLSINPQSMNSFTLKAIGRHHSPEEVKKALDIARDVGFNNINMDLIIGLPGEGCTELDRTLKEISEMAPENLTVHTLAVKKASSLRENPDKYPLPKEQEVYKMLNLAEQFADKLGMKPYYLYRQKYMVGPMENKGYALQGFECIYNIQVIEERQTIIGLGAGAASKYVNVHDWTLTSTYNPKDPQVYIDRVKELINKKAKQLIQ